MKAISLWQPWGSLIAQGWKTIETRHWATAYRGPIAIHAAKRWTREQIFFVRRCWELGIPTPVVMPLGVIVATAHLEAIRPTDDLRVDLANTAVLRRSRELYLGDFGPGRYGWLLRHVRQVHPHLPFVGRQGLFDVPDELLTGRVA